MNAIFTRTSVREFTDKPVTKKQMKKLMQAAMAAPSAGNQKPWEFYIVTDDVLRNRLSQCSDFAGPVAKAPLVIVPCTRVRNVRFPQFVSQDMAACVENILIEAADLELGALWMGVAPKEGRIELVRNALNIPEHLEPFALIAVGNPVHELVSRKDRLEMDRVHFNTAPEERFE